MKRLRHAALGLILILSLTTSAFAAEVPENLVVENLNGQQRMVKTYILAPDADPDSLKEPSFDYDGFHYTWAYYDERGAALSGNQNGDGDSHRGNSKKRSHPDFG